MKPRLYLALSVCAVWCWAALRPSDGWLSDLAQARDRSEPLVVLVAAPDRPLSAPTRAAVDAAWRELRPAAARVALESAPPSLAGAGALSLCVLSARGELVARRAGPLDAEQAKEWLGAALDAAASDARRREAARGDPRLGFAHAETALHLGARGCAEREFLELARAPAWSDAACERLARLAILQGDVALARERCDAVSESPTADAGRLLLTRGLIEAAERHSAAACLTLARAVDALAAEGSAANDERDLARLELARARADTGAASAAVLLLDDLARESASCSTRDAARRLAAELSSPTP